MADFLVRVDVFPWTAEVFRHVSRAMFAEGFAAELVDGPRARVVPAGEFLISGPLTLEEVSERAALVLRRYGRPFTVLAVRYVDLAYRGDAPGHHPSLSLEADAGGRNGELPSIASPGGLGQSTG